MASIGYWLPSLVRAAWFLLRRRPDVVILQWWTGTVLHYLHRPGTA
jgi:hypothetical protein